MQLFFSTPKKIFWKTLFPQQIFWAIYFLREAPFPSGGTNPNPTISVLLFSSLRIIIDFCEEDLRVGTAQMPDGKTSTKFRRSKEENRLSLNKTYRNVFEVLIWVTKKWLFSEKVVNFDYCMPGDVLANLWRAMTCENVHWFRCRLHWLRRLRARAMHGHLVMLIIFMLREV